MAGPSENDKKISTACIIGTIAAMAVCSYFRLAPELWKYGIEFRGLNLVLLPFREVLEKTLIIKFICIVMLIAGAMMKTSKKDEKATIGKAALWSAIGLAVFLPSPLNPYAFIFMAFTGMTLCIYGFSLFARISTGANAPDEESFQQCDEKIENDYSVNIPYHYTYNKKVHHAWINLVAPFRASMVLGVPGSGKSFAVYNKCIEDMVRKGYTMFLYDYKFPDLTEELLTEIYYQKTTEGLWEKDKVKPKLYILNFDDPKRSNRCNPIHHSYITDPADTTEIADLLFKNINKGSSSNKGFDFFNESAKVFLDALTYFLANYDPDAKYGGDDGYTIIGSSSNYTKRGCYCTFPHIIELMAYNYKKTMQILQFTHGLEAKISPFASALEGGAMEQLQGQIASAQIPLGKFVSPALYWVMTGDDFTLDINNPEAPKIVCMGNNSDRQSIYGSALALYTSRMFKLINHKKKRHSAVLLDELPTVFIKGLDNLIATARSNKVAIILGAQDRSQLRRDYGDDESKVIFSTVGSILSGQVNEETAEALGKMFGKEFREQRSKSISDDSQSVSISFQQQEILPASKITTLTQGVFFGKVADQFEDQIDRKLFCGAIDVDMERAKKKRKVKQSVPYITDFFGGVLPKMDDCEKERLQKIYPNIAKSEDKLYAKFIDEKVDEIIMKNFDQIKQDVRQLVEKEFERTTPFAEAKKMEQNDN